MFVYFISKHLRRTDNTVAKR